jgi:Flp pilus assembly pilin Flp
MEHVNPREALVTRLVHRLSRGVDMLRADSGQTMAEYTVVLGVLIVAVAGSILLFATALHTLLQTSIISIFTSV